MNAFLRGALALSVATALTTGSLAGPAAAQTRQSGQPNLQAALHLRPDQQSAFSMWRSSSAPRADEIAQLRGDAQRYGTLRTPDRINLELQMMDIQTTIARRQADATRRFYATLSPDQQHTFDELTAPPPPQQR